MIFLKLTVIVAGEHAIPDQLMNIHEIGIRIVLPDFRTYVELASISVLSNTAILVRIYKIKTRTKYS
jgi:predicted signal transduction protein with EAL and GGDEF domain